MKKRKAKSHRNALVTEAEIERAVERERDKATDTAWAILFTVLNDKHGFDKASFENVWNETVRISNAVDNGEIDMLNLIESIEQCTNTEFRMRPFEMPKRPTVADLKHAKRWAGYVAQTATWVMMLVALKNVANPGKELIKKIYLEMLDVQDSLNRGIIRPQNLHDVLLDEAEVMIV